jgi:hypothetical protein
LTVTTYAVSPLSLSVTVADRAALEVFLATSTLIVALPLPEPGETVTHEAEEVAVQARLDDQLICAGELHPAAPTFQVAVPGDGAAAWLTVTTCATTPETFSVTVADLASDEEFAAAFTLMEALPVPDAGETVSQAADEVAVQA